MSAKANLDAVALTKFFHFLWKKNKNLDSCKVKIPDTIVYEHNFPTGLYYFDSKQISKKSGKELDTLTLYNDFLKFEDKTHGIIACYLSQVEDPETNEVTNKVEYLDREGLKDFFFVRKVRDRGILQRFITPKGPFNFSIQVIWSPHVTKIERRTNVNRIELKNTNSNLSCYDRSVTYEGPSHFSNQVFCAPNLEKQIRKKCQQVVEHYESTEHKKISRMVLYFKIDSNGELWLLYASSIRVLVSDVISSAASSTSRSTQKKSNQDSSDLSPRFRSVELNTNSDSSIDEEKRLNENLDILLKGGSIKLGKTKDLDEPQSPMVNHVQQHIFVDPKQLPPASTVNIKAYRKDSIISVDTIEPDQPDHDSLEYKIEEALEDQLYQLYSFYLTGTEKCICIRFPRDLFNSCFGEVLHEFNVILKKHGMYAKIADVDQNETEPWTYDAYKIGNGPPIGNLQHVMTSLKQSLVDLYKSTFAAQTNALQPNLSTLEENELVNTTMEREYPEYYPEEAIEKLKQLDAETNTSDISELEFCNRVIEKGYILYDDCKDEKAAQETFIRALQHPFISFAIFEQRLSERGETDKRTLMNKVLALNAMDRFEESLTLIHESLKNNIVYFRFYIFLADQSKEFQDKIQYLNDGIEKDPSYEIFLYRSRLYSNSFRETQNVELAQMALADLQKAKESCHDVEDVLFVLTAKLSLLSEMKDYDNGVLVFDELIKLQPSFELDWRCKKADYLYSNFQDHNRALRELLKVNENLESSNELSFVKVDCLFKIGQCYESLNQYTKAMEYFEQIVELLSTHNLAVDSSLIQECLRKIETLKQLEQSTELSL